MEILLDTRVTATYKSVDTARNIIIRSYHRFYRILANNYCVFNNFHYEIWFIIYTFVYSFVYFEFDKHFNQRKDQKGKEGDSS